MESELRDPSDELGPTDTEARAEPTEALANDDARFRFVTESLAEGYFDLDVATGRMVTSASLQRLLGVPPVLQRGEMGRVVHRDDLPGVLEELEAAIANRARAAFTVRVVTAERPLWMLLRIATVEEAGRLHLVGTFTDVTAVRRTEEELHALTVSLEQRVAEQTATVAQSEALLRMLIDGMPDGVLFVDERGRIELANARAAAIFGVGLEQLTHVAQVIPSGAAARHAEYVSSFVEAGAARLMGQRTIAAVRADGEKLLLDIALVPLTFKGKRRAMARITDVTASKIAEATSRRLAAIVESSEDAIIGISLDGNITSWNRAAEHLFGYSAAESVGRSVSRLVPSHLIDEVPRILDQVRQGERVEPFDTVRVRADGAEVNVAIMVSPVRNGEGQLTGASKIARDITARKRAEAELRSVRERLLLAAEAAEVGIWVWNLADNTLEWDERMFALYGVEAETSTDTSFGLWSTRCHPDDLAGVQAALNASVKSGSRFHTQFRIVLPAGEIRHIQATAVLETDESGKPRRLVGINRDITEARRREAEILSLKERYEHLFAHSPDAYFLMTAEGTILDCNLPAETMLHGPRERIIGLTALDLAPRLQPDGQPSGELIAESLTTLRRSGRHRFDLVVRRFDGTDLWVEISVEISQISGEPVALMAWRDITERRRAQVALMHLAAIVESSSDAILSKTLNGVITTWNGGAERLFGYLAHESVGQSIMMLIPDHLEDEEARILERIRHGERVEPFETIRLRKDKSAVHVSVTVSPTHDSDGRVVGASTIVRDITEAKARAEELRRSNAELEQFAYVASHDLQEPLRMVANYTELLRRRYEGRLDEKADKYIHYASDGARRMQTLVSDLLAYSRVGSQGKPLIEVESGEVFDRVLVSLKQAIAESSATIKRGELPRVLADQTQLHQLLQNLIGNAIKFRADAPPKIVLEAVAEGAFWRFSVKDNGVGFDMRYADRIFLMFQRLNDREKYTGSGIGLAIAKRVVERHGGKIWVDSAPNQGTTFFFTMPAAKPA